MEITLNPYIQVVSISLFVVMMLLAYRMFMKAFNDKTYYESNKHYSFGYFFVAIALLELSIYTHIHNPYVGYLAIIFLIASVIFIVKNEGKTPK
jgi:hypothetical protein